MTSEEMQVGWQRTRAPSSTASSPCSIEPSLVRRRPDPFLDNYFKRIDPEVAASFTAEQRRAIRTMFAGRSSRRHSIDLRHSFGLGQHRFYFVMLGGRERRLLPLSQSRGALTQLSGLLGYLVLTGGLLAALTAFVYFVKG